MTNEELKQLKADATQLTFLPLLLTDGEQLLDANGDPIDMLSLLTKITSLRAVADRVQTAVLAIPFRPEKKAAAAKPKATRKPKAIAEERDIVTRDWVQNPPTTMKEWLSAPPGTPQPEEVINA